MTPHPPLPTPADERPTLTARPVLSLPDALLMGHIRNRCREGFSRDTSPIDDDRQRRWWAAHHRRVRAYLYADPAGDTVGYGALLQRGDGCWVSSCAVLPEYGGRGWGRAILHHLVNAVAHPVYAQARNDNEAAVRLHNSGDWALLGADNELTYFVTRPKVRLAPPSLAPDDYEGVGLWANG